MIENLEYYKVFYYVGKNKSITAAAKELMISQPAVSQSIHQLEKALGCSLFQRTSRGMKFTAEGDLLYRYVERGVESIDLGQQRLKQLQHLEAGEVRIGASDMTLRFFLLPYLEKFHELYPGIKVTVTNGPTPETLEYLNEDRIDFGVISTSFSPAVLRDSIKNLSGTIAKTGTNHTDSETYSNISNYKNSDQAHSDNSEAGINSMLLGKEGLVYFPVAEIEDVFVAGRRFIQYKNRMMDFSDLEKLPLILLEGNSSTRSYIDSFLTEHGVSIQPEFELSTSDMIVQFALRNLGVGCVVKNFAQEYLDSGVLFELRFNSVLPKRKICVISDESRPLSVAASKLLSIIKASLDH